MLDDPFHLPSVSAAEALSRARGGATLIGPAQDAGGFRRPGAALPVH